MLELRRFAVHGASSLASAIETVRQASGPLTLLTDLRLREGSGLDLIRAIRSDPDLKRKVNNVILMTGHIDLTEQMEHEIAKQDLHILFKPVDIDMLLSLLVQDRLG